MEVTAMAAMMFAVPAGYFYGRPMILRTQETVYNKLFSISDEQYQIAKQKQIESIEKEKEAIRIARETEAKAEEQQD